MRKKCDNRTTASWLYGKKLSMTWKTHIEVYMGQGVIHSDLFKIHYRKKRTSKANEEKLIFEPLFHAYMGLNSLFFLLPYLIILTENDRQVKVTKKYLVGYGLSSLQIKYYSFK